MAEVVFMLTVCNNSLSKLTESRKLCVNYLIIILSVYREERMRPAWYALAVAFASYLLAGLSGWATVFISFLVFLFTGGCSMATHACKTVPRDISYVSLRVLSKLLS